MRLGRLIAGRQPAFRLLYLITSIFCFSGCAGLGPVILRNERSSYNEAIHDTNAEQLLLNIVRSYKNEPAAFSTLAEVDSQPTNSLQLVGGSSNIGAITPLGGLTTTLGTSETSIQKHVTVSGFELIQQVSSPIKLRNIQRLQYSNQPTVPTFRFSVNNIGPFLDYNRVINIINFLNIYGAIRIEARNDNTMTINLEKEGFIDQPNQTIPVDKLLSCVKITDARRAVRILWKELTAALGEEGGQIILRSPDAIIAKPTDSELAVAEMKPHGTVVFTRSAIGALNLAQDSHDIIFLNRAEAELLRAQNREAPCSQASQQGFYLKSGENRDSEDLSVLARWRELNDFAFLDSLEASRHDARDVGANTVLILVETSAERPAGAYVSISKDGVWYSIDNDDDVSKNNFGLLNAILTIQAVPSSNTPTPTTISAGRPGG
jgi:hypothetical protein